ncbi:unnamed protein product [Kluyveromyces dobzhanskii CBS 2104]|uniref:RNA helicase n=1 Tax=Kluyveromyces dobzhanskii CBS 2104 TaxID=1427455 RepID=A0A0A8L955_9SACH|nr:unnamed protein product [Kluyveromyces dobzhanskii CBS 2104]
MSKNIGEERKDVLEGSGLRRGKRTYETIEPIDGDANRASPAGKSNPEAVIKSTPVDGNADRSVKSIKSMVKQNFLTKKQRSQLHWLVKDLQIWEEDVKRYGWDNLTVSEREEISLKRELLELLDATEKANSRGAENASVFQMPAEGVSKKHRLTAKLRNQDNRISWEEEQMKKSVIKADADEIKVKDSDQYEFVFDTEAMIDFTDDTTDILEPGEDSKLAEALEEQINKMKTIQETRKSLPVYQYREDLLSSIRQHQVLIVVGETGSGKTTQLPQFLVEDGYTNDGKCVVCTQPRRVAATSVAARVADEMDVFLGKEVGYNIRFDDRTTPDRTILKYMTDGMLLREFLNDPQLSSYSAIMIDEAHERTLSTDILLGLLRGILQERKDLRLIISSATMNATKFSKFFFNCPIFNVPGRRFPVDIHYTLQPEGNYLNAAITTVFQIHTTQRLPGDILVFLTGQEEIESMQTKLVEILSKLDGTKFSDLMVVPIYANLPQEHQAKIFEPTPKNCRKVVLATNIAETSLTINGIKYVIDPGFVKEQSYSGGISKLVTVPCSRASVDQRAGRAGRLGPGKCFRLFTKWSYFNELEKVPKPEILRTKLNQVVLLLLSLGINDLLHFPMLDKPKTTQLSEALDNLYAIGALNSKGTITKVGQVMCDFPCEPEYAKVIYSSVFEENCKGVLSQIVTIISMLQESNSIFIPGLNREEKTKLFGSMMQSSDHMLYLWIYEQWEENGFSQKWCRDFKLQHKTMKRVLSIRQQLWKYCVKLHFISKDNQSSSNALENTSPAMLEAKIIKCFISGFPTNVARLSNQGYTNIKHGLSVTVHPSSVIFTRLKNEGKPMKFILYQSLMLTSKEFIRDCITFDKYEWLTETMPHLYK